MKTACGLGSSKVTFNQEGDDTVIFRILEKVHERPTFHIETGGGGPLLPDRSATQGVDQPQSKSTVYSFYSKPSLGPTEPSRHRGRQCKGERSRGEE